MEGEWRGVEGKVSGGGVEKREKEEEGKRRRSGGEEEEGKKRGEYKIKNDGQEVTRKR